MSLLNLIYMNDSPTLYPQISIGLGNISSYLKSKGHNVILFDTYYDSDKSIVQKIQNYRPALLGISTTEIHSEHAFEIAGRIKNKMNIPIIFGGVFPTICPDECLRNENVDMVCVGDGEYALHKMLSQVPINSIGGVWRKNNGSVIRNGISEIAKVEDLRYLDYSIFRKESIIPHCDFGDGPKRRLFIWTGKGCAYNCSYCCNSYLRKELRTKIIHRGINSVIEEMIMLKNNYSFDEFFFTDENFLYDSERVREFCYKYAQSSVNKAFGFLSRPDMINYSNEAVVQSLQRAQCVRIHMGIETGNEYLRKKFLNRNITNDEILEAFRLCKKYRIKTGAFNIIGFPFETIENVQETYDLNVKCGADYVSFSLFYPFKGTILRDLVLQQDYIEMHKEIKSYFSGTVIKSHYMCSDDMVKLSRYLQTNYPKQIHVAAINK